MPRVAIPVAVKREVLIEAGYRCAVPTCRNILALDLHHIEEVQDGGPNDVSNLIALCPTCHALYTRGTISRDAINAWKTMLVSLSAAFDRDAVNKLLFLKTAPSNEPRVSGDGVLEFANLIGAGLAEFSIYLRNGPLLLYTVKLTEKGRRIIDAWFSGDRIQVASALAYVEGAESFVAQPETIN